MFLKYITDYSIVDINIIIPKYNKLLLCELFKIIPNKKDIDYMLLFSTCYPPNLYLLYKTVLKNIDNYQLLPDVNKIIKLCYKNDLYNLYKIIPNKEDIEVIEIFDRCDDFHLADLYSEVLKTKKHYEILTNIKIFDINNLIKKSNNIAMIHLYRSIPNKLDVDNNLLISKCLDNQILEIYTLIENKENLDINKLLELCDKRHLLNIYKLIPNKQDVDVDLLFRLCRDEDTSELKELIV